MSKRMLKQKKSLIRLKILLLGISLNLAGCAVIPPFPEVEQCAYSIKFNKWRCCNTETKACRNVTRNDSSMEAAQALSADDYKKVSDWVDTVKQIAEERCK